MLDTHWYILGAGAIGTLLATRFLDTPLQSTLLVRPSRVSTPITFVDLTGTSRSVNLPQQTVTSINTQPQPPIAQLILTTKAHQSFHAMEDIQSRLVPEAIIVVMQNGMGVIDALATRYPQYRVIAASTTEGANRPDAHTLVHAGSGETWIGAFSHDDASNALAHEIAEQWQALPLNIGFDPHIHHRLWTKLAINCAINPLTVTYQCRNGELLERPEALTTMAQVCTEIEMLMTKQQIPHQNDLFDVAKRVAQHTGQNVSSMLQDYRNGRTTEIEFINGYVVRCAASLGLAVTSNQRLVDTITQLSASQTHH